MTHLVIFYEQQTTLPPFRQRPYLIDTSSIRTEEFNLPIVNAKLGDNGIMFYGRESDFDSSELTIDVISNGAVAMGTVYAQPQKTGVLWDAYLLKAKADMNRKKLLFLTTSILAMNIKNEKIHLPSQNQQPDYALMETLISAIQKLAIKDVVLYADRKITDTKSVIAS